MHPLWALVDISLNYLSSLVRFGLKFITEFLKSYWSSSTAPTCKVNEWTMWKHVFSAYNRQKKKKKWCCEYFCLMNFILLVFMERHFILNIAVYTSIWSACNMGDLGSIPGLGRSPKEGIGCPHQCFWTSLVAQLVRNLPAMWETCVRSLGWEDPLEKGKATHSSILAWRIPWTV